MNNLLQSLSSQRLQLCVPDTDLKRLLSAVKEGRSHDAKLADAFYDSLEGVLHDLRTVTLDNRDAEAFLKPVSKTDYPDYYEIITNPMDLQTMLKKVKQKHYKSKREFQDDLELIWSNCFVYNTGDGHPLRLCATRLKAKATRLLHNITDRKERVDPTVPSNLSISLASSPAPAPAPPKLNGIALNGHSHNNRQRSTPPAPTPLVKLKSPSETPTPGLMAAPMTLAATVYPIPPALTKPVIREVPFLETPAFVRTPSGMATFMQLDAQLDGGGGASTSSTAVLVDRLRSLAGIELFDSDSEMDVDVDVPVNGDVGDKRKIAINGIHRPRKRARMHSRTPRSSSSSQAQDPVELWWDATRSCTLMANAVPTLKYSSSSSRTPSSSTLNSKSPPTTTQQGRQGKLSMKRKPRKQKRKPPEQSGSGEGTLLAIMNNNIRTMKRVRRTHDKFLALNPGSAGGADDSGLGGGGGGNSSGVGIGAAGSGSGVADGSMSMSMSMSMSTTATMGMGMGIGMGMGGVGRVGSPGIEEEEVDVRVDDAPWRPRGRGLAMGEREAGSRGVLWTSKAALDVFAGVTAEYLLNVGRTIRFMCDKYSRTMTPEEIILHTLFESGITHIRDLERYIKDDVIRYGGRLSDLEKKLVGAYREVTAVDALDDDAFFGNEDDDEEENELVMGNFADAFGEDFLGLRELGIAGEHGLSSLTVPKKLLKGKYKGRLGNPDDSAKPTEPPPPYPPPPPFIPLDTHKLEDQIGLLRPFYLQKFSSLPAASAAFIAPQPQPQPQPSTTLPPASAPALPAAAASSLQVSTEFQLGAGTPTLPQQPSASAPAPARPLLPIVNPSAPPVVLPEDPPNPTRTKIGPLGQILKTGATGASAKKKAKAKEPAAAGSGDHSALGSGGGDSAGAGGGGGEASKKKKTAGTGKKKEKGKSEAPLPAVVVASA
ncbi:hypothetical protein BD410DRAFT_897775 [Rickenella mellea]|uniref:Bromo domain-containing protein n=1 Tax=Rickenella mellea TaxID=50990 RepID=A0A4Y7Q5F4_9AGAM|nr:hypothetical protein BD410DRAFT_897775 [Rickenella mellea]